MNIGESLLRLRETMKISKERKWNIYFAFPDFGTYPNLQPLPKIQWAGHLRIKLDNESIGEMKE